MAGRLVARVRGRGLLTGDASIKEIKTCVPGPGRLPTTPGDSWRPSTLDSGPGTPPFGSQLIKLCNDFHVF